MNLLLEDFKDKFANQLSLSHTELTSCQNSGPVRPCKLTQQSACCLAKKTVSTQGIDFEVYWLQWRRNAFTKAVERSSLTQKNLVSIILAHQSFMKVKKVRNNLEA